jgi:hypothetical protein
MGTASSISSGMSMSSYNPVSTSSSNRYMSTAAATTTTTGASNNILSSVQSLQGVHFMSIDQLR